MTTKNQPTTKIYKPDEDLTSSPPLKDSNQGRINELVNSAHKNGSEQGKTQAFEAVYKFLKQKSLDYFISKNDDVAKVIRSLSEEIKKVIP
jgi:hypothetical protein